MNEIPSSNAGSGHASRLKWGLGPILGAGDP